MKEEPKQTSFEAAGAEKEQNVFSEFMAMLRANKKWWLLPIVLMLFALGALIILGATGAAPFIYTLF